MKAAMVMGLCCAFGFNSVWAQTPAAGSAAVGKVGNDPQSVISFTRSLNARLHLVPVSAVKLPDGYWGTRSRLVVDRTLPALRQQLDEHGVIDNFLRVSGKKNVPRKGRASSDVDLYKWIEAASWAIASPDTGTANKLRLQADIESLIPVIAAAQDGSGYLDTNFTGDRVHLRFTDLLHSQEDGCLTQLLFAGIAYVRATQNRSLLDIGIRFADYLLQNFGPNAKPFVAGHPELISAFVELYRTVGETKYLDFARYLLGGSERDRLHLKDSDIHYMFSGKPFISRSEMEGQAVSALQAVSGGTDYFAESGDPAYKHALDLLWNDFITRKMSVTGGAGLRNNDTFGDAYDVTGGSPNSEVPVALANASWNLRLLALTGDAKYADVIERALYNAVSAGFSAQTGSLPCGRSAASTAAPGDKTKYNYYETETCPPEIPALFESLGSYFYATGLDGIYVSLFNDSEMDWHLDDGTGVRLIQTTNYPAEGEVKLTVYPAKPAQFALHVRYPQWASGIDVSVNGEKVTDDLQPGTFINLSRLWQSGDAVTVNFTLQPAFVRANPRAGDLWGKAAVERGPVVYSLQQADQGNISLSDLVMRSNSTGSTEVRKDFLGGTTVVKVPGFAADKPPATQPLYSYAKEGYFGARRPVTLVLAPYWTVGTRETENVETWIPTLRITEAPPPPVPAVAPHAGASR
jgi:uncharacterized protein